MRDVAGAIVIILALAVPAGVWAQRGAKSQTKGTKAAPATKSAPQQPTTDVRCAAELGAGVKSQRQFCDVFITTEPNDSVTVTIPAHTGAATLMFDLHPRFTVANGVVDPSQAFVRFAALVAVVRPNGQVIERAAVAREYRTVQDLFDRIGGGPRPSGFKAVAPGQPEAIKVSVPAGLSTVGIVGVKLDATTKEGTATHDGAGAPARPIAIVSNLRVAYTPK
jgi:hypothetical protein